MVRSSFYTRNFLYIYFCIIHTINTIAIITEIIVAPAIIGTEARPVLLELVDVLFDEVSLTEETEWSCSFLTTWEKISNAAWGWNAG